MWTPEVFWNSTPRELYNAYKGRHNLEEARGREDWERTRWLATVTLSPHAKKGQKIKPTDLMRFPWEGEKVDKKKMLERLKRL